MITVLAVITAVGSVAAPGSIFAYAYMKTENIWVPVILHFMNNNLIPIISGEYDISVLENQTTTWASLIPALILNGIFLDCFCLQRNFEKRMNER